jgi:murein L,D-transpeptidase YcbB/YkuD
LNRTGTTIGRLRLKSGDGWSLFGSSACFAGAKNGALSMTAGGRAVFGLLIAMGLAAGALAAPVNEKTADGAPRYADFYAIPDRTAERIEYGIAAAVESGALAGSDAKDVAAFYRARGNRPVWIEEGKLSRRALAVIARIEQADEDGLDAAAYRLPWKGIGAYVQLSDRDLAAVDVELSSAVVAYARHAYGGRVQPSKVSANFGYEPKRLAAGDVLGLVAASPDPAETLAARNPPQAEFARLRAELARLRAGADEPAALPEVPAGPLLKPGMRDARMPVIRARLGLPAAPEAEADIFDETAVAAVKAFQAQAGLRQDGIVGRNTLAAMNGRESDADPVTAILVNMERWRWMPRHLGDFYVRVNVPNFNLDIYRGADVVHTTRIVVGKVSSQTPIFSDQIEHIVVNPYWNVPASIVRNEMLPAIRSGGGLRGYQVFANIRGRYRAVDPRSINWRKVDARKIQVRQPPGARNALGEVKFLFPNKYDVYLHDTPSKSLFEREVRAFSHGCMRVMNPWDFAEALLSNTDQVSAAALRKRVGGGESWVNLDDPIPVHITYFTAWVDAEGRLELRPDIYGHDKRLAAALGLN